MQGPSGSPLSASRPLGTSSASTGLPLAFTASIASANSPAAGREVPVPSIASTTRSAAESAFASCAGCWPDSRQKRSAAAAPSPRDTGGPTTQTATVQPCRRAIPARS